VTTSTLTHPAGTRARFSPVMVAIIALAAFAAGLGLSAAVPWAGSATVANAQPSLAFDAVGFRAEERAAGGQALPFDAVKFRAEERER
jgi:hypothetical protein